MPLISLILARYGSVAVAALLLVPLALLARRRRWSALVLGGTVAVLAIELSPLIFPHFSDAVSLSQSRRAAGFIPFAVALAGGAAVVSRYSRALALLGGLVGGIWLQVAYSGDFGLRAARTEPSWVVWIALYGGLAALVVGGVLTWLRRDSVLAVPRGQRGGVAALAVFLFVLPVVVHGVSNWGSQTSRDPQALTPGLIRFLQQDVPPRSVVLANLVLDDNVIPEFIDRDCAPERLAAAVTPLLRESPERAAQLAAFARLDGLMATPAPPADLAADAVIDTLQRRRELARAPA